MISIESLESKIYNVVPISSQNIYYGTLDSTIYAKYTGVAHVYKNKFFPAKVLAVDGKDVLVKFTEDHELQITSVVDIWLPCGLKNRIKKQPVF